MNPCEEAGPTVDDLHEAIMRAVAYADVFDFPLRIGEIHRYLPALRARRDEVRAALANGGMVPARLTRTDEFFHLPDRSDTVATRRRRARASATLWTFAQRYGSVIARLPYVRLVAVSGSLAVGNAELSDDVDFFVIAAHGHVWLTRAAIILVVRWARRRDQCELCPNFVLSEGALQLAPGPYVARELAQLVPLAGIDAYLALRRANAWADDYLPNACDPPPSPLPVGPLASGSMRRGLERLLASPPGRRLERWEMDRKVRRFRTRSNGDEATFGPDYCKGHFDGHGGRIMEAFAARLDHASASPPAEVAGLTRRGGARPVDGAGGRRQEGAP